MKHHFENPMNARGIDPESGVVRGATICTAGVEAKGHNLRTDLLLLRQLEASANGKGTVPVGLDHKSGVKGTAGAAKNFRVIGNKLLADIEFFRSHPDFTLIMDQLSTLGGTMGISASFTGDASHDGFARCKELLSCDVVNFPAANPTGLFSAQDEDDDEGTNAMRNDELTSEQLVEALHELLDHVEALEEENAQLQKAIDALRDADDESDDEYEDDEGAPVVEEKGARRGPYQYQTLVRADTVDFADRVKELQRSGMDPKRAHIATLKELARQEFDSINL